MNGAGPRWTVRVETRSRMFQGTAALGDLILKLSAEI